MYVPFVVCVILLICLYKVNYVGIKNFKVGLGKKAIEQGNSETRRLL